MSIPRNFWANFWRVSSRARAKCFTRFLGMYWSIQISFFMLLRPKTTNSISTSIFNHLSKSLKFLRKCLMVILKHFWTDRLSRKLIISDNWRRSKKSEPNSTNKKNSRVGTEPESGSSKNSLFSQSELCFDFYSSIFELQICSRIHLKENLLYFSFLKLTTHSDHSPK